MEKISIIIPLHEYTDTVKGYLTKALDSVKNLDYDTNDINVLFGCCKDIANEVETDMASLTFKHEVHSCESSNVFGIINNTARFCLTNYFSILEFDDEYTSYWFKEFNNYLKSNSDASVYIPINNVKTPEDKIIGYSNEIAWSTGFSGNELGYLDIDCLKLYMDFNVTGAIFNTEDFISVGALKPSMEIATWYEFLMRVANLNKNIYVVPKVGYIHLIGREGSFMKIKSKEITQEKAEWFIKTAQEEYKYTEEREIAFTAQ